MQTSEKVYFLPCLHFPIPRLFHMFTDKIKSLKPAISPNIVNSFPFPRVGFGISSCWLKCTASLVTASRRCCDAVTSSQRRVLEAHQQPEQPRLLACYMQTVSVGFWSGHTSPNAPPVRSRCPGVRNARTSLCDLKSPYCCKHTIRRVFKIGHSPTHGTNFVKF